MVRSIFAAVLALPLLVLGAPSNTTLPPCSNVDRPCSCPAGTTFKNVSSYGIIGATAADVGVAMNNCKVLRCSNDFKMLIQTLEVFNTDWTGLPPVSVSGTDDVPGATRTFNITANGTSYELTELVQSWPLAPDLCNILFKLHLLTKLLAYPMEC